MRFVMAAFGLVFTGIGATAVVSLASISSADFGAPPLGVRVIGSLIGVAFMLFGVLFAVRALRGPSRGDPGGGLPPVAGHARRLTCPSCGAPLGDGAEVSPSGDVKCPYCSRWFNVARS